MFFVILQLLLFFLLMGVTGQLTHIKIVVNQFCLSTIVIKID